ncbi:BCD family MFS transporter [Lutimaribacter sp. EGI FJ00015]|uniref:BCD family MFS transporter n=1 Tax=Lutimaribacter degradans TaxID=2945989 RepID=A0ACC5ZVD0_9RHOB|nr:BCD family MFS transporter [Lutimaribacter sp. EGI FJ00013]MCM2562065.1 BCD family MFS transporter [Lutimaribacter sp. EGI FJ00013]MCO0615068.1 BCD family MFS transporter [Lutimaribacter sp. EGI FJ00015]MCO0635897.1 BCD family MFS transporter [Lutimaribacter sp. EGI FJ00014]
MTLSWVSIIRLGLVQMALGMIVVLTTATMNRVMVVELALPAILPGLLVSLYYGTQFLRPHFGHGADSGGRRTPWIIGGVATLGAGAMLAAFAVGLMAQSTALGIATAIPAFLLIGLGIGAAGTNLLALLAARVAQGRQAAAGSAVWIMMIFGLAATGITAGQLLDPYSPARLLAVTAGVAGVALTLTLIGTWRQERTPAPQKSGKTRKLAFRAAAAEMWADTRVRAFTIFVFASMLAYNLQDLILEPFAGHVFGMTVGESTALGGMHHAGALVGMVAVLLSGTALARWLVVPVRVWIVGGCLLSGASLLALAWGGMHAATWPVAPNIFILGLANGAFAVAAIGAMMGLAREGDENREGIRMGLFGAAQAIAFGAGSFLGTAAADIMRSLTPSDALAYGTVFAAEGGVFLIAAILALSLNTQPRPAPIADMIPGE